ncbi:uncharacterized protein METZ01_LOCUS258688, partial [marine metagenome]
MTPNEFCSSDYFRTCLSSICIEAHGLPMNRPEQGDYSHRRTGGALKFRWQHDQHGFVGPSISQLGKFHVLDDVDPLVNEQML